MNNSLMIILGVIAIFACIAVSMSARAGANNKPWLANDLVSAENTAPAAGAYDAAMERYYDALTKLCDNAFATRHLLAKYGTDGLHIDLCGVSDLPLGEVDNILATGERASVLLLGKGKTKVLVAAGAVTPGAQVFTAASGQVQTLPAAAGTTITYYCVGIADSTAAIAGDLIRVVDCPPFPVTVAHA